MFSQHLASTWPAIEVLAAPRGTGHPRGQRLQEPHVGGQPGIFSGMFSHPTSNHVLHDLGDKVIDGLVASVDRTRADFERYRREHPDWVARSSKRGLANWLHDALWAHLVVLLDGNPDVHVVDDEPLREFSVGQNYKLRAKRHAYDGSINSYPTQGALDFLTQPPPGFEGLDLTHLAVGYTWIKHSHAVGPAVLSLHDGAENVVWCVELPRAAGVTLPSLGAPSPMPPLPRIELNGGSDAADEGTS